nr:ABC transporter substrate-binding protein [Fredinandcohnia onubensis]
MIKKFLFTVFLISLFLFLAACGSESSSGGDKKTTLTYWSNWNEGEPQQQVMQQIITDYEKVNPDVKIEVEWMGRQVLQKVRNAILSGNGPDIIDKNPSEIIGALGENVEPLDGVLEKNITNEDLAVRDVFLDGVLDLYKDGEKLYFIPYQLISSGFFYDKNMFEKYNVSAPKTWDEFIEVARTFKDAGIAPLAQDGSIGFYNAYYFYWLNTRINGSGAFHEAAGDTTGKAWDNPGFLEVAKKEQELVDAGFFKEGYEGSQFPTGQTQWAQGDAAMILNGTWIPQETGNYATDEFSYDIFPFPEVVGGKGSYTDVEYELIGWAAPKGANVEVVEDFIAFGMQKVYHQQIVDKIGNMSTRSDIEAPETLQSLRNHFNDSTEVHKIYDGVRGDYPEWWSTVFLPTHDKLLFGDLTAEEFIKEIKQATIDFYKK